MSKSVKQIAVIFISILLIVGCDTAFVAGGRTVGISSGRFIYTEGLLTMEYNFPFKDVWNACEKTLADMKASEVETNRKIAKGKITATVEDEKVVVSIEYASRDTTLVSIRVGIGGNNLASQLIHEKIGHNLWKIKKDRENPL
ncbi:MAG: DUF3568 family protein [Syntrophales bacterium]|nr:DUF3568 family protein [Syntrophales bacterium]